MMSVRLKGSAWGTGGGRWCLHGGASPEMKRRAAALFLASGAARGQISEGKRRLRCSGFRSARELGVLGAAAGSPRRRRGGGRETVLGGVAKGGSSSARGAGSRSAWGRHVKRRRSRTWPGATQRGGGRRGAVGGEKQRNREGKKTGT